MTTNGPILGVVSSSFPPQTSGSAVLLSNLLSHYDAGMIAIAGHNPYLRPDPAFAPPCPTQHLALPQLLGRVYERLRRIYPAVFCATIRRSLRNAFQRRDAGVVLGVYPREDYFVAGFRAATDLGVPFYAYMHDLWAENMPPASALRRFAEQWEPIILRRSHRILCMTEAMQEYYGKKYGIHADLLPHTVRERDYLEALAEPRPAKMAKPTVLFVGAVSPAMNLDALRVLASASELLPQDYEMLFCTSMDLASLTRAGIVSSRLKATYVSRAEVQHLQSQAHVLVAPLSHKNCCREEVQTVFSTKLLEYLVSGRPIVIFAPDGSYQAESASRNGWGYVVTEDSPAALAAAIQKVITDERLTAALVRGALQEARSRSAKVHAERLREWVVADGALSRSPDGRYPRLAEH